MFRPVRLVLILVLMLTSIGLGTARGTLRQGSEVVLCTGHGIVVTRLPGTNQRQAHFCPDMALSLLAAIAPPPVVLPVRVSSVAAHPQARSQGAIPVILTPTRVRDPPFSTA
ncbi:MAG: hypothetical protein L0G27_01190 [Paracoccus sp. (in: a-proteobacteria)]|nr:hypothetical protein [Paracoccus sp. (in: a-proteobacteria)]